MRREISYVFRSHSWAQDGSCIAPLYCHRYPLPEVKMGERILCGIGNAVPEFPEERACLGAKHSHSFHSHRHKIVAFLQMSTLSTLLFLGLLSHCTCLSWCQSDVWWCQSLWTSGIPHQHFPSLPRNDRHAIRPFSIRSVEACGFQVAGDVCRAKGSLDDLVDSGMARMATLAVATPKTMGSCMVHHISTMLTVMGFA